MVAAITKTTVRLSFNKFLVAINANNIKAFILGCRVSNAFATAITDME